jgi:stage V sporulation protein G
VIRGPKGFFVAMPSKKRKDGTFRDIAHPINRDTRVEMEKAILNAYQKETGVTVEIFQDPLEDGSGNPDGGHDPAID